MQTLGVPGVGNSHEKAVENKNPASVPNAGGAECLPALAGDYFFP